MLKGLLTLLGSVLPVMSYASPETEFWKWFMAHETALYRFESPSDPILGQLSARMSAINAGLTFEFSGIRADGIREFIISAGGIKAAFPAVEALYDAAPSLERWQLIKFRPRRESLSTISFDGRIFDPSKVLYVLAQDGDKVGIVLMFDGYVPEDQAFAQAGYLMLDEALGEYTVETKVGFIEMQGKEGELQAHSHPLTEITQHFDEVSR